MGLALAREAYIRGADLTLIVANVSVEIPSVFNVIRVETSSEMNEQVLKLIPFYDIFISAAAVSDFEFKQKSNKKIDSSSSLFLNLKPTTKSSVKSKKSILTFSLWALRRNSIFHVMKLFSAPESRLKMRERIWLLPMIFQKIIVSSDPIIMKC